MGLDRKRISVGSGREFSLKWRIFAFLVVFEGAEEEARPVLDTKCLPNFLVKL
jgi:hypothetical protein